jgi:hypothetical protein
LKRSVLAILFTWSLLAAATSAAQAVDPRDGNYALTEDGSMPPYVVPVLRLVSSTHVEPTTGLVISESGLVLVPMDFATEEDEVIVLDGGTDIIRNGRPAHLKDFFPAEGLQILSVPGLRRQPAPFSGDPMEDGAAIELTAYPPAERIAEGEPPLHVASSVVVLGERADPAVSGDTPLPNVTGPVLDECGNVAAYSLAHDVQTMQTHPGTRYKWRRTLLAVLAKLQVTPRPSACRKAAPEPTIEPEETPAEPAVEKPAPVPEPSPDGQAADEQADTEPEQPGAEPEEELPPPEELDLEILPPLETAEEINAEPVEPASGWWWLFFALVLTGAGLFLHFWRRRGSGGFEEAESPEPPFQGIAEEHSAVESPPVDCRLTLAGHLQDGTAVSLSCETSSKAINLTIGRGQADLRIESAAVSRHHASLNGTAQALTLSDLGSNNGTSVNGVPCMEGEILYVEPGDVIILGDARLILDIVAEGDSEWT